MLSLLPFFFIPLGDLWIQSWFLVYDFLSLFFLFSLYPPVSLPPLSIYQLVIFLSSLYPLCTSLLLFFVTFSRIHKGQRFW
jgi:hypothetical protein